MTGMEWSEAQNFSWEAYKVASGHPSGKSRTGIAPGNRKVSGAHMRKKLQWLIISRLGTPAVLILAVSLAERGTGVRAFAPFLVYLGAATLVLSVIYFISLKVPISLRFQGYIQLSIDLVLISWLVFRTGDVES